MQDVMKDKRLLIMSDNITAVANVVKEGGNNNIKYIQQLKELYWLMKSNIFADTASHRNPRDEYHRIPFMTGSSSVVIPNMIESVC